MERKYTMNGENCEMTEQKLRVALLLPSLDVSGPVIFTRYLIMELMNKVDYIEIFYFKESSKVLDLGVKCTKLNFFEKRTFDEFDIVHSTMAVPDLYAALHIDPKKWVISMHNYIETDMKMLKNPINAFLVIKIWTWALQKCKNIIVSSRAMLDHYCRLLGEKNYSLIPYGIDNREWGEIDQEDLIKINEIRRAGYTVIGSAGNFIHRKGFMQLIDVLKQNEQFALVIIGAGPERERMLELCQENKLEERVFFPGYRPDSYNYYKYMDIYAHVSYSEGFGLAMLEAMAKGLPIVCSELDIYKEYFTGEDVCYFTPGDTDSLSKAFDKVVANKQHFGQSAFSLYEKYFNLEKMAQAHTNYYHSIMK